MSTFKGYEHKPPDLIKERVDKDFNSMYKTSLTSIAKVNKTDAETLKTNIGVSMWRATVAHTRLKLIPVSCQYRYCPAGADAITSWTGNSQGSANKRRLWTPISSPAYEKFNESTLASIESCCQWWWIHSLRCTSAESSKESQRSKPSLGHWTWPKLMKFLV